MSKPIVRLKATPALTPSLAPQPKIVVKIRSSQPPPTSSSSSSSSSSSAVTEVIDLHQYHQSTSQSRVQGKALVIKVFQQLIAYTDQQIDQSLGKVRQTHQFRLKSFKDVIDRLQKIPEDITSGHQAKSLAKVSDKMVKRIDEILQTQTLSELTPSNAEDNPQMTILKALLGVHGIGEVSGQKLLEAGVTSVADLRQKVQSRQIKVVNSVQIGLRYYEDFQQKIPYQEIVDLKTTLMTGVAEIDPDRHLLVEVCGSHRRQKPLSGDIDVLITHQHIRTEDDLISNQVPYLKNIVAHLKSMGLIVGELTSKGNTKFMGVCLHPQVGTGRRLDIRFVAYDSYYPSLLYFTGSMTLNKLMRTIALDKGYTLNEYGLYVFKDGQKGQAMIVNSEREIFEILGIAYLEPSQREIN